MCVDECEVELFVVSGFECGIIFGECVKVVICVGEYEYEFVFYFCVVVYD